MLSGMNRDAFGSDMQHYENQFTEPAKIDTTNIDNMVEAIRSEFIFIHANYITCTEDLVRFFKRIRYKQIHYETSLVATDWEDKVLLLNEFAKRHGASVQVWGMASIGIDHPTALKLCRKIAHLKRLEFTNENMGLDLIEEGQIDMVPTFEEALDLVDRHFNPGHIYLMHDFDLKTD
tara:strand:- start:1660 stop:2190 length:531 start_codon:yes stop_codon:yes gene_type:complete